MIAASMLDGLGYKNFMDVDGGFSELNKTKVPVTEYICPTTLL